MSDSFKISNLINNISDIEISNQSIDYQKDLIKKLGKDVENLSYQNSILEDKLLKSENDNSTLQSAIFKLEKKEINNSKLTTLTTLDNTAQLTKFVELQNQISALRSNLEEKDTEIGDLRSQLNCSQASQDVDSHQNPNDQLSLHPTHNQQTVFKQQDVDLTRVGLDKASQAEFKPHLHQGVQTDYFDPEEAVRLRRDLKRERDISDKCKSDNKVMKEEIERLKLMLAKTDRDNEKYMIEEVQKLKDEISALKASLDMTSKDRDQWKELHLKTKEELERSQLALSRCRTQLAQIEQKGNLNDSQWKTKFEELQVQFRDKDKEIAFKKKEIEEIQKGIKEIESQLSEQRHVCKASDDQNDELRELIDSVLYKGMDIKEGQQEIPVKDQKMMHLKKNDQIVKRVGSKQKDSLGNLGKSLRPSKFNNSMMDKNGNIKDKDSNKI